MPGFLLHVGATITCVHLGTAQATAPNPRVKVSGMPIVTAADPHTILGCPFNVAGGPSPCTKGIWDNLTASTRITSNKVAVLLITSQAKCIPNGTGVIITKTQTKVSGT